MTNNIAPFVQLMHEAETAGIVRSVRFFAKNTIGQFFWGVSKMQFRFIIVTILLSSPTGNGDFGGGAF